ncbi:hypothetical protein F4818DRAFT_426761 [Hypoxylon cercidicola]|nr:hypothetical protein F4818DRAFT_426761 [Hypoxylon cercidicola]
MANIPNLTSISVYSVYGYNLRQRATLSLSHLTHAKLTNPDKYWVKLSSDISRFSHYINPASRSLEVLEIEGTYYCTETFVLPQLRSITFNSAGQLWVDDMIKPLLGSSDKLQEFVYRSARYMDYLGRKDEDRFYDYHSYRPIDILRALREIGSHNTIQTLELDLRDEGNKREGNPWYFIETSLAYWKTLKNLRITQQTLWSPASDCHRKRWGEYELEANSLRRLTDILPDSIEFFQLSDITAEFLPSIVILAMHVEGRKGFPKLKKVHLHPSPQLVRQLKHAVAHENDANLMHEECKDSSCVLVSKILNCYRDAEDIFEKAGVEIKFPLEVLPLHTRNSEILQRQQDLCHWCPECHLDGTSCLARVV